MNKTEAKEKLHNLAFAKMNNKPNDLKFADVMQIVDQINEPEKVKLPKYVADKIDFCKKIDCNLFYSMNYCFQYKDSADWLEHNEEIFARAWFDGYNTEEQKYIVEIPNKGIEPIYLAKDCYGRTILTHKGLWESYEYELTEEEIKRNHAPLWGTEWVKEVE